MSMTIRDANAIQQLLAWTFGLPAAPESSRAVEHAAYLAERSANTLGAGSRGKDVLRAWDDTIADAG